MIKAVDLIAKFVQSLQEKWGYIWGKAGDKWTQAKQNNLVQYMVNKYGANWKTSAAAKKDGRYGSACVGAKWINHIVADCSGLFSYWFAKLGGFMYHGSDTMFKKYTTANGTLVNGKRSDGQELKPGTAVFVYKSAKNNYSHVGLYIGNNEVIEAASSEKGVIKSKASDKKWTHWGELKGVEYSDTPVTKPTLKKGDKGAWVTLAQTELINKGYSCGKTGADGDFGNNTEAAVKRFQNDYGLKVDGIIGQDTWNALDGAEPAIKYTVTVPGLTETQADALILQYPGSTKKEERG